MNLEILVVDFFLPLRQGQMSRRSKLQYTNAIVFMCILGQEDLAEERFEDSENEEENENNLIDGDVDEW